MSDTIKKAEEFAKEHFTAIVLCGWAVATGALFLDAKSKNRQMLEAYKAKLLYSAIAERN